MSTDHNPTAPALTRLAERFGIASHFQNAYGSTIAVSSETMSLLLNSMGVDVTSETEAQDALDRLERHDVRDPFPATVVVVPKDNWCLIQVNDRNLPSPLDWRVELESGEQVRGNFHWQDANYYGSDGNVGLTIENLPFGYHRLHLPQLNAATHLLVCPDRCWLPDKVDGGHWGIAVQLYLMRSATNWGIGDFSDLKALVEVAGLHGCGLIGLNPLHQMFLDNPEAASPYSPATRLGLNPLYIDVLAVPEWPASPAAQALVNAPAFQAQLEECRASSLVNYSGVTELKLAALRLIHQSFTQGAPPERHAAFAAFCLQKGNSLQRASLFQVLRQQFTRIDVQQADWRLWPAELQTAGSQAQREFGEKHRTEIDFQNWLQFIADEQLETAAEAAREQGMAVGLYRDLAVGCDASGAETWANPAAFLQRNLVGAPPDIFSPTGQNWGLPPFDPVALTREGYRSFAELIRVNMRHAGGLRIDHVMGLRRLFCIPEGKSPTEGAYVNFPLEDLIGVLALESQRQQCLVVGEDLGTVPDGFRERLARANVLSYRVLFFEQDFNTGAFLGPETYPELAFSNTGSHDLPTLLAWWTSDDIALKQALGLFPTVEEARGQRERRDRERREMILAFTRAGLFAEPPDPSTLSAEVFAQHAHRYLSMTKSILLSTQFDDMTGEVAPVNVPGTWKEHPNWRRKYRLSLEELSEDHDAWALVGPLARARHN